MWRVTMNIYQFIYRTNVLYRWRWRAGHTRATSKNHFVNYCQSVNQQQKIIFENQIKKRKTSFYQWMSKSECCAGTTDWVRDARKWYLQLNSYLYFKFSKSTSDICANFNENQQSNEVNWSFISVAAAEQNVNWTTTPYVQLISQEEERSSRSVSRYCTWINSSVAMQPRLFLKKI